MKRFYLLRHEDVHDQSGTGVVAEGIVFDSGMAAMTWLTNDSTVTIFLKVSTIKKLHGHKGKTEFVLEGKHKLFVPCQESARNKKNEKKRKEDSNG